MLIRMRTMLAALGAALVGCSSGGSSSPLGPGSDAGNGTEGSLPIPPCGPTAEPPSQGFYPVPWGYPLGADKVWFHSADPKIALVATTMPLGASKDRGRVYRTPDGGQTWCETDRLGSSSDAVVFTAMDPAVIYAVAGDSGRLELARTVDGGAHWKSVVPKLSDGTALTGLTAITPHPKWSNVVYAMTQLDSGAPAFVRSADGGATFASQGSISGDSGFTFLEHAELVVAGNADERVFVQCQIESFPTLTHTTRSFRWTSSSPSIELLPDGPAGPMAMSATSPLYVGGGSLSRSNDEGQTWNVLQLPTTAGTNITPLVPMAGPPGLVLAITDVAIFTSHDEGATWSEGRRLPEQVDTPIASVTTSQDGQLVARGTFEFFRSADEGSSWTRETAYVPLSIAWLSANNELIRWGGYRGSGRSDDGLRTWKVTSTTPVAWRTQDPNEESTFYERRSDAVFKSEDAGLSWAPWPIPKSPTSPASGVPTAGLQAFAIAPGDSRVMLARVERGAREPVDILRSTDGGASWETVVNAIAEYDPYINVGPSQFNLVFAPSDANVAYAGGLATVHRSTDGGQTWKSSSIWAAGVGGLSKETDVLVLTVDPLDPGIVLASGAPGIYRSANGGETWTQTLPLLGGGWQHMAFNPARPDEVVASLSGSYHASADAGQTWRNLDGLAEYGAGLIAFDKKAPGSVYISFGAGALKSVTGVP